MWLVDFFCLPPDTKTVCAVGPGAGIVSEREADDDAAPLGTFSRGHGCTRQQKRSTRQRTQPWKVVLSGKRSTSGHKCNLFGTLQAGTDANIDCPGIRDRARRGRAAGLNG